jgi:hypothetical protein
MNSLGKYLTKTQIAAIQWNAQIVHEWRILRGRVMTAGQEIATEPAAAATKVEFPKDFLWVPQPPPIK